MSKIKVLSALVLSTMVLGCGPDFKSDDGPLIEGGPEVIAQLAAEGAFFSKDNGNMLTAMPTAEETAARIKADGWDPRDTYADYAFTGVPGDVDHLPAEFEPAQALLIGWPSGFNGLEPFFAEIVAGAEGEVDDIYIFVDSEYSASRLSFALEDAGVDTDDIHYLLLELDSIWMRDYGPLLVETDDGGDRVIDFRYSYGRWSDDVAPTVLANYWQVPVSRPPLEAEGGNIQSDGAGRCITTEMMLNENYGNGTTAQDLKDIFRDYLGCDETVILPTMDGEGTGHVDMYATITGPKKVIVGDYAESDDPVNASILDSAAAQLKSAGFTVRRVPMPTNIDGNFRSYTNSLAVGDKVLVPVYPSDTRYESQAMSVFQAAYPGRTLVPIDSDDIIAMAGAIHCVTMTLGK